MGDRFDFLRINAENFLELARSACEKGIYNLAIFNAEQALQLMLKYLLAQKLGDFPKTHSLRILFGESEKLCASLGELYRREKSWWRELEFSYVGTRYFPVEYEKDEAEKLILLVEKLFQEVKACLSSKGD